MKAKMKFNIIMYAVLPIFVGLTHEMLRYFLGPAGLYGPTLSEHLLIFTTGYVVAAAHIALMKHYNCYL